MVEGPQPRSGEDGAFPLHHAAGAARSPSPRFA